MSAHFQYDRKFRIYITLVVLLIMCGSSRLCDSLR